MQASRKPQDCMFEESRFGESRSSSHTKLYALASAAAEAFSETNTWHKEAEDLSSSEEELCKNRRPKRRWRLEDEMFLTVSKKRRDFKGAEVAERQGRSASSASSTAVRGPLHILADVSLGVEHDEATEVMQNVAYNANEGEGEAAGFLHTPNGDGAKQKKIDRLSWTGKLQQRFLDAIQHLGVNNAVPKDILNHMNVRDLTREQVASHLQKYRMSLRKNKKQSAKSSASNAQESEAVQQRYAPGLPTAIGVPIGMPSNRLAAAYDPRLGPLSASPSSIPPLNEKSHRRSIPLSGLLQVTQAGHGQFDDPAFSRIREYSMRAQAALTADFAYPSAGQPVFTAPDAVLARLNLPTLTPSIGSAFVPPASPQLQIPALEIPKGLQLPETPEPNSTDCLPSFMSREDPRSASDVVPRNPYPGAISMKSV